METDGSFASVLHGVVMVALLSFGCIAALKSQLPQGLGAGAKTGNSGRRTARTATEPQMQLCSPGCHQFDGPPNTGFCDREGVVVSFPTVVLITSILSFAAA